MRPPPARPLRVAARRVAAAAAATASPYPATGRALVVVESPAKARKLQEYLGETATVLPTYGHVRDLPAKPGSVDPAAGFAMRWTTSPAAAPRLAALAAAAASADRVVLATDPDREGEAISWHVLEELKARGAVGPGVPVERAAFTSVTRDAVFAALASPRPLSDDLVRAYFARRALDYLYGFSLSPLLWRKLPGARSAGRVQSAALALVAAREAALRSFVRAPYWSVDAVLAAPGGATLAASLRTLPDGGAIAAPGIPDEAAAASAVAALRAAPRLVVAAAASRDVARAPPPPFVTASLQQAASALLGMSPTETMSVAQALYEGGEGAGGDPLITYMRTDGVAMPPDAVADARAAAVAAYGAAAVPGEARAWKAKAKNAQEAHEAIRPVDFKKAPSTLPPSVGRRHAQLYDLIWRRAVASQMADARLKATRVDVAAPPGGGTLRATAAAVVAPGFSAAYSPAAIRAAARVKGGDDEEEAGAAAAASSDDDDDGAAAAPRPPPGEDGALPAAALTGAASSVLTALAPGDALALASIEAVRHETRPPPRFSEATLVAALEAAGVGRPSTYAPTVRLLLDRGYVTRVPGGRRLAASARGAVLAAYLASFFGPYVDAEFTASLEAALDDVAGGRAGWEAVVASFWTPLDAAVGAASGAGGRDVVDALDASLGEALIVAATRAAAGADASESAVATAAAAARVCPSCGGRIGLKLSAGGGFFGCDGYPACTVTRPLWADGDGGAGGAGAGGGDALTSAAAPRDLGADPVSGLPVSVRVGPYGAYVQLGPAPAAGGAAAAPPPAPTKKAARPPPPRRASLPQGADPLAVSLDDALALLAFPRVLGPHPTAGGRVEVAVGRYGPYVRLVDGDADTPPAPLTADGGADPATIDLAAAVAALDARAARGGGRARRSVKSAPAADKRAAPPSRKVAAAAAKPDGSGERAEPSPPSPPAAGRAPNAYFLFCRDARPRVAAQRPGAPAAETAKALGELWRGLAPDERAAWEAKAAAGRAAGGGAAGAAAAAPRANKSAAAPKKAKPAKSDADADPAPFKRPLTAYMRFCADERPRVAATGATGAAAISELGARWRALSDDERARWEAEAAAGRAAAGGPVGKRAAKRAAAAVPGAKPKRPPSPYLAFCAAERAAVKAALGEGAAPAAIMRELGARWRGLTDAAKGGWKSTGTGGGGVS